MGSNCKNILTKIIQPLTINNMTLEQIKKMYNITEVFYGSGYDIYRPCIIVSYDNTIFVYPEGQGCNKPYKIYSL